MSEFSKIFKKNILAISVSAGFIFLTIWAGNLISVVTSRDILDPLKVTVERLDGHRPSSVKVLATLSRAGNTINLEPVAGAPNQWDNQYKTFIAKLMLGFKAEDFDQLATVVVELGGKRFVYSKEQFLQQWPLVKIKNEELLLTDTAGESHYEVYEAPSEIRANPLALPLVPGIFSSLNFNGKDNLLLRPLIGSLQTASFIIGLLIWWCLLWWRFFRPTKTVSTESELLNSQRQFMIGGLSILVAVIVLALINVLILAYYRPDTSQVIVEAAKIYLKGTLAAFLPKPVERLQFVVSILLSPFILWLSYSQIKRLINRWSEKILKPGYYWLSIFIPLSLFAVIYLGLAVSNFLYVSTSFSFGYFGKFIFGWILFPLMVWLSQQQFQQQSHRVGKYLLYVSCGFFALLSAFINTFASNNLDLVTGRWVAMHFDPVFYVMTQVMAGKTMLVNLTGLYGLYPIFLQPLFSLIGLNVLKFTFVFGFIFASAYFCIFIFLQQQVKSRLILGFSFLTLVFYVLDNNVNPIPYFQYWPIRTIFPCLMLLLVSIYAKSENKLVYYLGFIVSSLALLWNFDSGIIVILAWLISLCYLELFNSDKRLVVFALVRHFLVSLSSLVVVLGVYGLYTFGRSGSWPNLQLLWQYQKMFVAGYFLIPMPFPHLWVAVALVFLIGLLIPIMIWLDDKSRRERGFVMLFVTVLGLGLFSYYEGRSHDLTFYSPLYTVIILLALLADGAYAKYLKHQINYGLGLILLMVIFFISAAPFNLLFNLGKYYSWVGPHAVAAASQKSTSLTRNVAFIKQHTVVGERILIVARDSNDGIYYGESQTRAALSLPASTDIFFQSEIDRLASFLLCNQSVKVFIYPYSSFSFDDQRVQQSIKNDYVATAISQDDMALVNNTQVRQNACDLNK